MKQLLIVTDTYLPKKDGVIVFLKKIIPNIENFKITILAPNFTDSYPNKIKNSRLVALPVSKTIHIADYNSIKLSVSNRRKIKKLVNESDIIFIQDIAVLGIIATIYASKLHKPIIHYIHQITWEQFSDVMPLSSLLRWAASLIIKKASKYIYNKSNLLLVPYKSLADELNANGILTNKARVNPEIFKPAENKKLIKKELDIPVESIVIGYCGRLSKEKNLNTLRRAYSRLKEKYKNLFLLIVGDGLKQEAEKFKELKDTKVTGFINNVNYYLQAMDIFVLPSLTETTSLATIEAMSTSLPVLVTRVGYIKEYILNKYNGMFFPKKNEYILRKKIEYLINSPELRKKLGENARETIIQKFNWEKTVVKINKALNMF